ncbi:hypothetical protein IPF86_01130 [Candidatus Nomurabacteria bacterium]|jgi:uncharacterized membrane protein YphA (DoxX/SURF4 family)|nr:MAG: hypothetical protein IPF86_01130 [Candidatus Nomurabacteria bacterium]
MQLSKRFGFLLAGLSAILLPYIARAHEVYVLNSEEVNSALQAPALNFREVVLGHTYEFLFWGFVVCISITLVFFLSISKWLERKIDPLLFKIKPYAGHIAQATFGLALIASAYYGSIFGLELPFSYFFPAHTLLFQFIVYAVGVSVLFGFFPRIGSFIVGLLFLYMFSKKGIYMVSYFTYLGEATVLVIFGGAYRIYSKPTSWSVMLTQMAAHIRPYSFLIMRILFGVSLMFASCYAKFLHGTLALDTVAKYNLTNYFPFDPMFLVFGAFALELLIGLFFMIGFEIRFTSLFFLSFLTMSLLFFGEAVWPHLILIGTAIATFVHGYDEYTIEHHWYKKQVQEPVL